MYRVRHSLTTTPAATAPHANPPVLVALACSRVPMWLSGAKMTRLAPGEHGSADGGGHRTPSGQACRVVAGVCGGLRHVESALLGCVHRPGKVRAARCSTQMRSPCNACQGFPSRSQSCSRALVVAHFSMELPGSSRGARAPCISCCAAAVHS